MMRTIYRLRSRASARTRDEAGFTMIEMVISMFIFGIVIVGVGVGMSSSLNLTRQNRNRSVAANLASQQMDTVRSTDFTTLDNQTQLTQPTTSTATVEGVPYTLSQFTRWIYQSETGASTGPCQSPPTASNPLAYVAVTTSVSWNDMHGVTPVTSSTVVTPPVGIYDSTEGHIAVTVLNAAGAPLSGATVSISGPDTDTAVTTSDGCAFFAFKPIGVYTVALSSVSGKVDSQGSATPSRTATVKAASTTSVQFLYDTAAGLTLTLTPTTAGYTIPTSVPVSLGNTHLLPSGVLSYTTPTGSPRTLTSLFPFTDGYQAWAGRCSDADPQGINPLGAAYYSGATRGAAIPMTAGSTSSATVTLPSANLQFKRSSGSGTYTITVTHVVPSGATSDAGCPTAETYQLTTTQSITTATASVKTSLPFGTWAITWKNNSSSATGSNNITLSPLNANNPLPASVVTVT